MTEKQCSHQTNFSHLKIHMIKVKENLIFCNVCKNVASNTQKLFCTDELMTWFFKMLSSCSM